MKQLLKAETLPCRRTRAMIGMKSLQKPMPSTNNTGQSWRILSTVPRFARPRSRKWFLNPTSKSCQGLGLQGLVGAVVTRPTFTLTVACIGGHGECDLLRNFTLVDNESDKNRCFSGMGPWGPHIRADVTLNHDHRSDYRVEQWSKLCREKSGFRVL